VHRSRRLGKFAARLAGQVDHSASDLEIAEIAAALSAHGPFALEGRIPQRFVASLDACCPSGRIAHLGSTSRARIVASGALCVVNLFSRFERAVGVAYFNRTNFLYPRSDRFFRVVTAGLGLGRRNNEVDQRDDGKNRDHERIKHSQQQLARGLDGACVAFFVSRVVVVVSAHGVLKKLVHRKANLEWSAT
jgi:hypothetical protein